MVVDSMQTARQALSWFLGRYRVRLLLRAAGRGTEMLRYGLRVAVLAMPAPRELKTPEALAVVGPGAFGYPEVALDRIVRWTAQWVTRGGESLGKPTHFSTRDGKY